jgi:hypothetical protein
LKLTMPIAVLAQVSKLPGAFMRFIAVAELVGAVGLVLPGSCGSSRASRPWRPPAC